MREASATYAGLCPDCGLEVLAPGPETSLPPSITIGATTYLLPTHARFPVVRHWPVHRVAFSGQDGFAYTVSADEDGGLVRLGRIFGRMAAGFLLDGRAWWQDSLTTWRIETDPQIYAIPYAPGSTGGCWGDPTLARSWVGADDASPVVRGGVRLFNPAHSIDGQWIVGNHPTLPRHLAYSEADGVLYDAGPSNGTPMYPTVVLHAGEPVLVRSYPSGLLPRSMWTPLAAPVPAPVPEPEPEPESRPAHAIPPAFPRKMWTSAFFSYSEKYGDTDDRIGNAITVVEDETDPQALAATLGRLAGVPLIIGEGPTALSPRAINECVGYLASGDTLDDLGAAVGRLASRPERAIYAYLDRSGWPTEAPAWMTPAVIPEVQVYRLATDPRDAFMRRVTADLDAVCRWAPYVALCLRTDDFNGRNPGDATALEDWPFYELLIRSYPVVLVHFFADRRPGGMAQYPALRAAAHALCDAVPARPGRFDYWESATHGKKARLLNKLGQDVGTYQLSPSDRATLVRLVETHL